MDLLQDPRVQMAAAGLGIGTAAVAGMLWMRKRAKKRKKVQQEKTAAFSPVATNFTPAARNFITQFGPGFGKRRNALIKFILEASGKNQLFQHTGDSRAIALKGLPVSELSKLTPITGGRSDILKALKKAMSNPGTSILMAPELAVLRKFSGRVPKQMLLASSHAVPGKVPELHGYRNRGAIPTPPVIPAFKLPPASAKVPFIPRGAKPF